MSSLTAEVLSALGYPVKIWRQHDCHRLYRYIRSLRSGCSSALLDFDCMISIAMYFGGHAHLHSLFFRTGKEADLLVCVISNALSFRDESTQHPVVTFHCAFFK